MGRRITKELTFDAVLMAEWCRNPNVKLMRLKVV